MGTSQSRRDARPGSPLIPPWVDGAGSLPGGAEPQSEDPPGDVAPVTGPEPAPPQSPQGGDAGPLAEPRRFAGFRISLRRFAHSGSRADARSALRSWVSGTGGHGTGSRRVSRSAATGGAALFALGRAAGGLPPAPGAPVDVRTLAGLPLDTAIARIVDAFCPPGILDDELARIAVGEVLTDVLRGPDVFDPAAISTEAIRTATLALAAELVFVQVAGDAGRAMTGAPSPAAAVERENQIRELIYEAADVVGAPLLASWGEALTPASMGVLVQRLVEVVEREIATW